MKNFINSTSMNWACRTISGNMLLGEIFLALPSAVTFGCLDYQQSILTADRLIQIFLVCAMEGAGAGALIWLVLTRPMMKRKLAAPIRNRVKVDDNIRR